MPDVLFNRSAKIVVGQFELVSGLADSGLRVAFDIHRTLKNEPNKAEIKVWNLAEETRAFLEVDDEIPVQIEAGYASTSLLFLGNLKTASSESDGVDTITTVSSGDGEKALRKARVSISFPRGTPIKSVIDQLAAVFDLTPGNLATLLYTFQGGGSSFINGGAFHGSAAWELTRLLRSCGKEWSVQNGEIQILDRDKTLLGEAVLLSTATGLVGSPSIKTDAKTKKKYLNATMLLASEVAPGRLLVMQSKHISGTFRIETCNYIGDTHGSDWIINLEALQL